MSRTRRVGLLGVVIAALTLPALLAAAAAEPICDDLIVTHRPGGSTGDVAAVTVTAQALDRDLDGWASVGWEVAVGVEVRRVMVVSATGVSELPASATVADGGVLELHFCGPGGAAEAAGATPAGADAAGTSVAPHRAAPTAAVGSASGFVPRQLTIRRSGSGGATFGLSLLGASVGAALGGVVLLLSRATRDEVVR